MTGDGTNAEKADDAPPRCSCWVIMRGDRAGPYGWEGEEYEMIPDPDCPVHGPRRKKHPILEDIERTMGPGG